MRRPAPTRPRPTTRRTSSSTASPRASTTARTCSTFVNEYDEPGITKQLSFDETGEPSRRPRLRLQGRGRRDRLRPGDRADAGMTVDVDRREWLRPGSVLPGRNRARLGARGGLVNFDFLFNNFAELTITGLAFGAIYALIALGYTMVYGVLQLINFAHSEVFMYGTFAALWTVMRAGRRRRHRHGVAAIGLLLAACSPRWRCRRSSRCSWSGSPTDRCSSANAPRLIALISAIGASFVLAELMGLRDRVAELVRARRRPAASTSAARGSTAACPNIVENQRRCSRSATTTVTIGRPPRDRVGDPDDGRCSTSSSAARASVAASGRRPRTRRPPR